MKTYQKPVMIALSLTGNEQLCGSCTNSLKNDSSFNSLIADLVGDSNGKLTESEFNALFASAADTCTNIVDVEIYCKFTSSNDHMIAWS